MFLHGVWRNTKDSCRDSYVAAIRLVDSAHMKAYGVVQTHRRFFRRSCLDFVIGKKTRIHFTIFGDNLCEVVFLQDMRSLKKIDEFA